MTINIIRRASLSPTPFESALMKTLTRQPESLPKEKHTADLFDSSVAVHVKIERVPDGYSEA